MDEIASNSETVSDDVVMSLWPSIVDGIAWSETSEIAIAAGEHIELLIPKIRPGQDLPDQIWERLHLRVNEFSPNEVDVEEPLAFRSVSLGEEISTNDLVALQWSPQGLAKHGRCALAVLTQNLALSIWSPTTQPRFIAGWKRHIVINRVLYRYFAGLYAKEKHRLDQDKSERLKRLQRIRAFAWSPSALLKTLVEQPSYAVSETCKENFLAVANDNNEVILLRIPSPMRLATSPKDIENAVSVVARFSVTPGDAKLPDLSWSFEDYLQNQIFVSKLAWSPWIIAGTGSLATILVCATRSRLMFRRIILTTANGLKVHVDEYEKHIELAIPWSQDGILRWLPSQAQEANLKLMAITGGDIIVYGANAVEGSIRTLVKYTRDEWDSVAGCIVTAPKSNISQLYYTSHVSMNSESVVQLEWNGLRPSADQNPYWKKVLLRHQEAFNTEHRLGGHAIVKNWGMATSPMNDLMATCITLHPSHLPEYVIPADYRATLSIHSLHARMSPAAFVNKALLEDLGAETVAFSIKFWLKHLYRLTEERNSAVQEILGEVDKAISQTKDVIVPKGGVIDSPTLNSLLFHPKTLRLHRLKRLLSLFDLSIDDATSDNLDLPIIAKLTTTVLRLPRKSWKSSVISRYILLEYKKTISKLPADLVHLADELDLSSADKDEQCEICEAKIPFENFSWARCDEGHEFARCALTFLAIQAPGITIFCGICGKQYIEWSYLESDKSQAPDPSTPETENGEYMQTGNPDPEVMHGNTDGINGTNESDGKFRRTPTLAQLLFAACNSCIYCGGKFVGSAILEVISWEGHDGRGLRIRAQSIHLDPTGHCVRDRNDAGLRILGLFDRYPDNNEQLQSPSDASRSPPDDFGIRYTPNPFDSARQFEESNVTYSLEDFTRVTSQALPINFLRPSSSQHMVQNNSPRTSRGSSFLINTETSPESASSFRAESVLPVNIRCDSRSHHRQKSLENNIPAKLDTSIKFDNIKLNTKERHLETLDFDNMF